MLNGSSARPSRRGTTSRIALFVAAGGVTFFLGLGVAYGVMQISAQKQELEQMNALVAQMAGQREADQKVTRAIAADLLSVQTASVEQVVVAPAPLPAIVEQATNAPIIEFSSLGAQIADEDLTESRAAPPTAEKIRSFAKPAFTPIPVAELSPEQVIAAERFEALAIVQAGVQELAAAVVKGEYDIRANTEADASGRIHFVFVGHEENQSELERFLADAAERGIVKHSNAVVDSDGSVNGQVLLCDLVERTLENGTLEEQRAGAAMRAKAQAVLASTAVVDEDADANADAPEEKFYVVEKGDSLAYIALQFYGSTSSFAIIYEANRDTISQPDRIRIGQRLRIPSA